MGSNDPINRQLELLNLTSWTWETRKPFYYDIHGFATLVYEENMVVFGGRSNELNKNLDGIHSYDPKSDTWTDRGKLLSSHYYLNVIYSSGWFLVFGDTSVGRKSERCSFDENSLICEFQSTSFGSVD